MASAKMHEALLTAWSTAEFYSRKYEGRGPFAKKLPVTPDAQARIDRVNDAQEFARNHTDREVAAAFPDVVQNAVTNGHWERIKP